MYVHERLQFIRTRFCTAMRHLQLCNFGPQVSAMQSHAVASGDSIAGLLDAVTANDCFLVAVTSLCISVVTMTCAFSVSSLYLGTLGTDTSSVRMYTVHTTLTGVGAPFSDAKWGLTYRSRGGRTSHGAADTDKQKKFRH